MKQLIGTAQSSSHVAVIDTLNFSEFIVFSDETGDVGLKSIDPKYPFFAINFCILKKADYLKYATKLKELKISYFNSDLFIFHDVEISQKWRKMSSYRFNNNRTRQLLSQMSNEHFLSFIEEFSNILQETKFTQITAIVDKRSIKVDKENSKALKAKREELYKQTLREGLHGVLKFLKSQGEQDKKTCILFEESGAKESMTIKSIFYDFCTEVSGFTNENVRLEYEVAPKQSNNEGLQLADMTAKASVNISSEERQRDRTHEIVKKKLFSHDGSYEGYGLIRVIV